MKRQFGTVTWHGNPHSALEDAEARPDKAIWLHIPNGTYAIGDEDDLPYKCDEGCWYEITLEDLRRIEESERTLTADLEKAWEES